MKDSQFLFLARQIEQALLPLPVVWDGKQAILDMKNNGYRQWRQMEWIGFYFQFLCERNLCDVMQIPGPRYGRAEFDGFLQFPWDFKAHVINSSRHQVIVNDKEAIQTAIESYGQVGVLIALGKATYNDEDRSFKKWHDRLKGKTSAYEKARRARGAWSRLRKTAFDLKQLAFVQITEKTLAQSGSFQRNFRNSNGRPRREKVLVNLKQLDDTHFYLVDIP